ncbi:MAG: recombination mediator RecR [Burkholderiales bacterium]|uniref:recombination mediator RecR n=1 Tax=uncultured Turicimonas sp. TaxID=1918607 RepID=UPI001EB3434E|nr:recombination mediator RecR [uncultured Turicimonas sp.]MBS4845780.1 recombination mediator RecR [Burkholderiales bacterium]
MASVSTIEELIDSLRQLPGIGPKAAQRMAYQLLTSDKETASRLGNALLNAVKTVKRCPRCNNLTDKDICKYCSSIHRDDSLLCVVENVADMMVIEQSLSWNGRYFILMGRLSPLNGIGPNELELGHLIDRASEPEVKEVVIATSFTAEGEATALAITELLAKHAPQVKVTRIAKGIPAGAELEYTDVNTVAQAMLNRRIRENN